MQKLRKVPALQGILLGQRPGVFLIIMNGPQDSSIPALGAQPGQRLPECGFRHPPQHILAQTGRHSLHFPANGREFPGQLAVAGLGIGHAKSNPLRQQPRRVDFFNFRGTGVRKICKDDAAHGTGQLVQQAAGLAEISILRILTDLCHLRPREATAILPVEDDGHSHLKRRRAGKAGPPQNIAGGVGIKAAGLFPQRPESLRNAPDQAGGMGALPLLGLRLAQVNDVQLVEPPRFDPDEPVIAGGRHRDQIQCHRRRQPITVLVVGVVAAQLGPARGRVQPHLPPRPKVELKLFQCRRIACPLPPQLCRTAAVQRPQCLVPFPRQNFVPDLCTRCHRRTSPQNSSMLV